MLGHTESVRDLPLLSLMRLMRLMKWQIRSMLDLLKLLDIVRVRRRVALLWNLGSKTPQLLLVKLILW